MFLCAAFSMNVKSLWMTLEESDCYVNLSLMHSSIWKELCTMNPAPQREEAHLYIEVYGPYFNNLTRAV